MLIVPLSVAQRGERLLIADISRAQCGNLKNKYIQFTLKASSNDSTSYQMSVMYHNSATVASQCRLQQLCEGRVSVRNMHDLLPHRNISQGAGGEMREECQKY